MTLGQGIDMEGYLRISRWAERFELPASASRCVDIGMQFARMPVAPRASELAACLGAIGRLAGRHRDRYHAEGVFWALVRWAGDYPMGRRGYVLAEPPLLGTGAAGMDEIAERLALSVDVLIEDVEALVACRLVEWVTAPVWAMDTRMPSLESVEGSDNPVIPISGVSATPVIPISGVSATPVIPISGVSAKMRVFPLDQNGQRSTDNVQRTTDNKAIGPVGPKSQEKNSACRPRSDKLPSLPALEPLTKLPPGRPTANGQQPPDSRPTGNGQPPDRPTGNGQPPDDRPTANGQRGPTNGQSPAAKGQAPSMNGQAPPTNGQAPPTNGQAPPINGVQGPMSGQHGPTNGDRPTRQDAIADLERLRAERATRTSNPTSPTPSDGGGVRHPVKSGPQGSDGAGTPPPTGGLSAAKQPSRLGEVVMSSAAWQFGLEIFEILDMGCNPESDDGKKEVQSFARYFSLCDGDYRSLQRAKSHAVDVVTKKRKYCPSPKSRARVWWYRVWSREHGVTVTGNSG